MKKKVLTILFSILMIIIYILGIVNLYMMLSHYGDYYTFLNYGEDVMAYYTYYPIYFLILWLLNLICGLMSPILLLFNDKYSKGIELIAFISDLLFIVLACIYRNRIQILGVKTFVIDIVVLVLTFLFYLLTICYFKIDNNNKK